MVGEGIEDIRFLVYSRARVAILDLLHKQYSLNEQEIRHEVNYSRTTINRNLDALLEAGWIQKSDRTYSITTCGATILNQFVDLIDTVEAASRLNPFLKWVPQSEFDVDISVFQDADVITAKPGNTLAMVDQHVRKLKTSKTARAVLPIINYQPYEVVYQRIQQGKMRAEVIGTPVIVEMLRTDPAFADMTEEMLNTGRFKIFEFENDIPYYLGILDDTVQIGADDEGRPQALVETASDDARAWAEEKYKDFKQTSRRLCADSSARSFETET